MHNFNNGYYSLYLALILVISSMSFWFRDIITEGTAYIFESLIFESLILKIGSMRSNEAAKKTNQPAKIEQFNVVLLPNKQLIKEISAEQIIPPYLYSVLVGLLLSSGWASIHNKIKSKARIKFRQSYENKEYLYYVYREISVYCEKGPYRSTSGLLFKGKPIDDILISTRWLYSFTEIYYMFFNKNGKIVPHNIYDLLTPFVLAQWVMAASKILQGRGLILYADNFNVVDVVKLINVLTIKYRLHCNLLIEKNKPRIYIYRSNMDKLVIIIKPYTLFSILKKLI